MGEEQLENSMKEFFHKWKPKDEKLSIEFYTDFHMLVRTLYADAQKPMVDSVSSLMRKINNVSGI